MKLKYYLRGLGIGIAVTALVLGLTGGKESLTDDEIRARAAELGMSENTVLSELQDDGKAMSEEMEETADKEEPEGWESEAAEAQSTEPQSTEPESEDTQEERPEVTEQESEEKETVKPEDTQEADTEDENEEKVSITVKSGDTSWPVAQRVHAAGLVKDAAAFDDFMCDNGYSRYLRAGVYEIPVGADEEEIARILARK
ncbi:MAG: hypothetical protein J6B10_09085 [Lachnospiraceae bacterium]|nr:hypothetical protein [Lachnospiraceae bacterium]